MTNTDGTGLRRPINKSKCGDNIFFFSNKTIQLVLTEDPNCVVVISLQWKLAALLRLNEYLREICLLVEDKIVKQINMNLIC